MKDIYMTLLRVEPRELVKPPALRAPSYVSSAAAAAAAPALCLAGAFALSVGLAADVGYARPSRAPLEAPRHLEPAALDAISLAQDERMAGDELTVRERIPWSLGEWTAEETPEGLYWVLYRETPGARPFVFEVDLEDGEVLGTPETVDRLTLLRVREEAETRLRAYAMR